MRLVALLGGAGLVAALCVGCSSETAPVPAPLPSTSSQHQTTPTPTPTPTPAPTATPPPMPEAARGTGKPAMRAFVRHYVSVINFAEKTGNVAGIRALSAPSCGDCERLARFLSRLYDSGGHIRPGAGWMIEDMIVVPGETIVAASMREAAASVYTDPSASPSITEADHFAVEFELRHADDGWLVTQLART